MTAYETRAATEDERDRLALLRQADTIDVHYASGCHRIEDAEGFVLGRYIESYDGSMPWSIVYRPRDKQGEVEPFDVQADWEERA